MAKKGKPKPKKKKAVVLGLGLDNRDGHVRQEVDGNPHVRDEAEEDHA